ncbi:MAE_28990/MAE_18760 family HEPN-like nuclease [Salmonella enterica]|uniref:MAE_28990/MAE_18760 family HEPN-like nuclease n=1 Tax=Salmonella enterica TaxID=28901 RepID=UPI0009B0BDD9|nr:MAE_28990/MAE_18760 family HEPN-like nuclease [Salmonella enterica]
MSKIRTLEGFQDYVDTEMAWRIKEIAHLTASIDKSSSLAQRTIIRASIPLLYAHWEGFIKNSAAMYIEYISNLKLNYSELEDCLIVLGMRKKLFEITSTNKHDIISESLKFILTRQKEKAILKFDSAIQTESNLKSHVFDNIAKSIGVSVEHFNTKYNFIDESLLKRRNCIAHGEYLDIDANEWRNLSKETLTLMRTFKNEVLNNASTRKYLKPVQINQ